jgi:methionine biosynthesis protein MetW
MTATLPFRLRQVAARIPPGATVLDVGCANGELLQHLRDTRGVDGRGIEIDSRRVAQAVARGLSVVQGDADHDLAVFPDGSVDYAVLSEALQAMQRPDSVIAELLRIGRRAIVAFPNFGHWRVRADLALRGRMPMTPSLPDRWFETANIHHCTIEDFRDLMRAMGFRIEQQVFLAGDRAVRFWPNLRADHALFVLAR